MSSEGGCLSCCSGLLLGRGRQRRRSKDSAKNAEKPRPDVGGVAASQALKEEVQRSIAVYMAGLRKQAQEEMDSAESRWASAWAEVLNHAVLAAQEGFMTAAAQSDVFVGSCITAYMEAAGQPVPVPVPGAAPSPVEVNGHLTKQMIMNFYKRGGTSKVRSFSEAELQEIFEFFDTDHDEKMSFGEFVTMQFVPMYLSVQSQAFPTPAGVALKPELSDAGLEYVTGEFQGAVEEAMANYAERLRAQAKEKSSVEIAGRTSILSLSGKQNLALTMALIESQVSFMSVLLSGDRTSASVAAACEQWKAFQIGTFKMFDRDDSGELDAAELSMCMQQSLKETNPLVQAPDMGVDFEQMSKHFLNSFDVNQDGKISLPEWLVSCAAFESTFLLASFYQEKLPQHIPLPGKDASLASLGSTKGISQLSLLSKDVSGRALSSVKKGVGLFGEEVPMTNMTAVTSERVGRSNITSNPNPFSVPGSLPTGPASLAVAPTPGMKAEVARAVAVYMARIRRKANDYSRSMERKWAETWSEVVNHAVLAAQEAFMNTAVKSDVFVGNFVAAFMEAQGSQVPEPAKGKKAKVVDVSGELNLAQVKGLYRKNSSTFTRPDLEDSQLEQAFELADQNSSNGLSFGQFVTMQFVPLYLSVQAQGFPTPEGVASASKQGLSSAGLELLTPELQAEVEAVLDKYAGSLRKKVSEQGDIEIVGRTGILAFNGERELALSIALIEAQVGFISVLLCGDRGNPKVAAACEQWKAYEVGSFIRFDEDKSGELDASELASCMQRSIAETMPFMDLESIDLDSMSSHFMSCFDVDSNGKISLAEWLVSSAAFQSTFLVSSFYREALPSKAPHVPGAASIPCSPAGSQVSRLSPRRPGSPETLKSGRSRMMESPLPPATPQGFLQPTLVPQKMSSRFFDGSA